MNTWLRDSWPLAVSGRAYRPDPDSPVAAARVVPAAILVILFSLWPSISRACSLADVFAREHKHDVAALLRLEADPSESPHCVEAVRLAEFMADPVRFRDEFIRTFPTDSDGFTFELVDLRPYYRTYLFPYKALLSFAADGDRLATDKAIMTLRLADGAAGEIADDGLAKAATRHPSQFGEAISTADRRNDDVLFSRGGVWYFVSAPSKKILFRTLTAQQLARIWQTEKRWRAGISVQ